MVAAVPAGRLLVALGQPLEVRAGHIVEQELEIHPEPAPVPLHEVFAEPVLVRPHLVQGPVETVVIDRLGRDAGDVLQRRACIPGLGNAQLRGLTAELPHREHRGHIGPRNLLPARLDERFQQLMQAQSPPERQPQEHRAELTHPPNLDPAQVGQFPLARLGVGPGLPVEEFRGPWRWRPALQKRLDVVPPGLEVLLGQLPQGGDDPLPRSPFGAHRLAERPVLVEFPSNASAVLAQKHALSSSPRSTPARGGFSTTFTPCEKPRRFPSIPGNPNRNLPGKFLQLRNLG